MKIDRYRCQKSFEEYYKNYDVNDEKIELKIYHSKKVSELCELISRALKLNEEDIDLTWLIGLVHDIGRFEQLKIYNTFQDAISIDHAMLGSKILFEENEIRNYVDNFSEDMLIKKAIEQHSAYEVTGVTDERTLMFCNILRDADKIDILRVAAETPPELIDGKTLEIYETTITNKVMDDIENKRTVLIQHRRTPIDCLIGRIALVFGLENDISKKIVLEQGYIKNLFEFGNTNYSVQNQIEKVQNIVMEYLEE